MKRRASSAMPTPYLMTYDGGYHIVRHPRCLWRRENGETFSVKIVLKVVHIKSWNPAPPPNFRAPIGVNVIIEVVSVTKTKIRNR
jgi:hypothetical protein